MERRGWIETSLATVFSLIMSISGPFLVLFMLPLQILAIRDGKKAFSFSAAGVIFGSIILKMTLIPDIEGSGILIIADTAIIIFLVAGLYAVNYLFEDLKTILKLLIVTAAAGLASIPVLYYLNSDLLFYNLMIDQLDSILVMFKGVTQESSTNPESSLFSSVNADEMYNSFKIYFLSSFLVFYFFLQALTWRLGNRIGLKSIGKLSRLPSIKEFYVPEKVVGCLVVPLTVTLLRVLLSSKGINTDPGPAGYAVSNALYVMGLLYGLQGYGLLQYLMEKRGFSSGIRKMTGFGLIISFFIFPVAIIPAFVLPGLGVSELWINYRRNDKELIQ